MKTYVATGNKFPAAVVLFAIAVFLVAGCGGGGGQTAATATGTGNAVRVSVSQTSAFPAGAVTANAPAVGGGGSASQNIDNVFITVTKVALLPGAGSGQPDPNGETPVGDNGTAETGIIVTTLAEPKTIDLLHLPGGDVAQLLNSFDNVPAGTYGKIRLYYTDPKVHFIGAPDNTAAHATANFHLDIHFVGGDLVIPVTSNPGGGVRIFDVTIRIVLGNDGLKVTVNPSQILIRPQVFADFIPPVIFEVSGTASEVLGGNAFDLTTADQRTFHIVTDSNTGWSFQDGSTGTRVGVSSAQGRAALDNGVSVIAFGAFTSSDTLAADDVVVVLPDKVSGTVVSGTATNGWLADNTFKVMKAGTTDNVIVFPSPSRAGAFYVNLVAGRTPADNVVLGDNVVVRGFLRAGLPPAISGFWITIGP